MGDVLKIERLDALVFRAPIAEPRMNAFGAQTDRPAVLIRLVDTDGVEGWGEVFCNWPSVAAEHRARLAGTLFKAMVEGKNFDSPETMFRDLTAGTARMRLQSDERGPFDQTICGIDIAAWDLLARRRGQPLWKVLAGDDTANGAPDGLEIYASGLAPPSAARLADAARAKGFRNVKVKVGFDQNEDIACLRDLRRTHGTDFGLMADSNQAWTVAEAKDWISAADDLDLIFLEEPIAADAPFTDWKELSTASPIPLATGENLRGRAAFRGVVGLGGVRVIQPDVIKWGGLSLTRGIISEGRAAGAEIAPHYLAGGIGLLATAHLMAACAPEGLLEFDVSENPLRDAMTLPRPDLRAGRLHLPEAPGLGAGPDFDSLEPFRVTL
ncbi:mandelate racemase/muconate lactonizing enzyme family protein [Jannaschia formosa]|uniref:mandelate racemase/muconate lactonizing enzyme family protein n=1 Tax=Jannaschia formosa TaxID=2259592 RepID=UPI000E1BC27B|nr:mandelate racemase/muconate lactonizing enzyme family protein [Jannaschia formosa]TFL16361.1 mandelate racemase/muconate lactonizing enzyme family protein [Jannaschia formosa]